MSAEPIQVFEVDPEGVLTPEGFEEPRTRAEVYEDRLDDVYRSAKDLADLADEFEPLAWAIQGIYQDARDELEGEADDLERQVQDFEDAEADGEPPSADELRSARERLEHARHQLATMPEDSAMAATPWLRRLGDEAFRAIVLPQIDSWLADEPDLGEEDYASCSSGQEVALRFFDDLGRDACNKIGVRTIDGEHPGSSFFGAVLKVPVAQANTSAEAHDLPIRFRMQGGQR